MDSIIKDYEEFVLRNIAKFDKLAKLVHEEEVTPVEVNTALASYMSIALTVQVEYQRAKTKKLLIDLDFDQWYDQKFEEAKVQVINEYAEVKGSAKPAVKEFETRVRTEHCEKYYEWRKKKEVATYEVRFFVRLLDLLKRYDNILSQLSNNMRSELRSLSLDKRAIGNTDPLRTQFPGGQRERVPVA